MFFWIWVFKCSLDHCIPPSVTAAQPPIPHWTLASFCSSASAPLGIILHPARRGDSAALPTAQVWQPWFGKALCCGSDQGSARCSMARSHRPKSWGPFYWGMSTPSAAQVLYLECEPFFFYLHSFFFSSQVAVWLETGLCKWGSGKKKRYLETTCVFVWKERLIWFPSVCVCGVAPFFSF